MTSNNAPTDEDAQIGARIRERRKALGVTREVLAAAAGVGTSQISKYELGTKRVPSDRILRFAAVLKVNVTYFFADYFSVKEIERVISFVGSEEGIELNARSVGLLIRLTGRRSQLWSRPLEIAQCRVPSARLRRTFLPVPNAMPRGKEAMATSFTGTFATTM